VRQLKQLVEQLRDQYRVAVRRACRTVGLHSSAWYYQSRRREDRPVRQRIKEIAATRVRYGMWRIYILLRREGFKDNHKRVHRIYKEEGLNLRSKRPRRNKRPHTGWSVLPTIKSINAGRWILCKTICLMAENSVA
jgi:putative transposase